MAADPRDDDEKPDPQADAMQEVHARALRRFDVTVQPQMEQRAQSLEARRFAIIPGAQWEGQWGDQFENGIRIEVNKVRRGLRKLANDYRQNRIVPDFRPAGGSSTNETADMLDGLHRADSYHFKAQQARDNAVSEAMAGGFGAYRLVTDWADPYDKDSDAQRINPALIIADADQCAFFDGNSKLYDKSDARFAFVLTAMTPDALKEDFGDECIAEWPEQALAGSGWFDWFRPDMIRVADYYEIEDVSEKLHVLSLAITGEEERYFASEIDASEIADRKALGWTVRTRNVKRRRVHKYVMSGAEVLRDSGYIAGDRIPIVPVYFNRDYIDNQERFTGYVQDKMDAQRLYNAKVSKLAETDALAPNERPVFYPDQVRGHEDTWANANIDRLPYSLINPVFDEAGQIIAQGPVTMIQSPQLAPVTGTLLQIANTDLTEDDVDGADTVKANTSAEAMDLAAARVDAKSGPFLDNIRQSIACEGEIYLGMSREVYFEPGREVETMSEEGDDGIAVLHQAVTDRKTGEHKIINDLARGAYKVIADVTEATSSLRDKTSRRLVDLGTALSSVDPEGAAIAFQIAALNMDGEGIGDYQAYTRKKLVAAGIMEPTEEEQAAIDKAGEEDQQPDPMQQLQMAMAQAEVMLKQAQAARAMAGASYDTERAKDLGAPDATGQISPQDAAKTEAETASHLARARLANTTADTMPGKLAVEAANAETKRLQIKRGYELAA